MNGKENEKKYFLYTQCVNMRHALIGYFSDKNDLNIQQTTKTLYDDTTQVSIV